MMNGEITRRMVLAGTGLGFLCGCAGVDGTMTARPIQAGPLKAYAIGALKDLTTWAAPRAVPDLAFQDGQGRIVHLSDFKGQVVVLNMWATWAAPSRFEIPSLAALQADYAGKNLAVLVINGQTPDQAAQAQAVINTYPPLVFYQAPDLVAKGGQIGVYMLSTTLIIDRQGREVARMNGDADWSMPEVRALIDHLLAE